jgi:hypothetical protein
MIENSADVAAAVVVVGGVNAVSAVNYWRCNLSCLIKF